MINSNQHPGLADEPPLPHPFTLSYIRIIGHVLWEAWQVLPKFQKKGLPDFTDDMYGNEDEISTRLREILNDFLDTERFEYFKEDEFQSVIREGKERDHTGRKIDKMPDLQFRFSKKRSIMNRVDACLHVECKVIDDKRHVGLYVNEGLIRFVNGDYSRFMSAALMVAYVLNDRQLPGSLSNYFKRSDNPNPECKPMGRKKIVAMDDKMASNGPVRIFQSVHRRTFIDSLTRSKAGPITIYHLWLNR